MSEKPTTNMELLLLCGKVRDDALTPADAARLDVLLQASDDAKALYVQYMSVISLLESRGASERGEQAEHGALGEVPQDVLTELLQAERDAEPIALPQPAFEPQPTEAKADQLTWQQVGTATAYLLNRPKVWSAIAAVLALALVLIVVLRPGTTPAPLASDPNLPADPGNAGLAEDNAVATLTATHNARWAQGAFVTGSDLRAGQTLTLTAGFAEITTKRGAVAILEAPATVELIDNNNALRLHTGKLVGICETSSSKGFVVRTDQAEIADLGTRFGVAIDHEGGMIAQVFSGSIAVQPLPKDGRKARQETLTTGDSLVLDRNAQAVAHKRFEATTFTRLISSMMGLKRVTGKVVPAQTMPNSLRPEDLAPNANAYLFHEHNRTTLQDDLDLSIASPGKYVEFLAQPTTLTLRAGDELRSYAIIIQPDPVVDNKVYRGSITFDGEIVGVIADAETWRRFTDVTAGRSFEIPLAVEQLLEGISPDSDPKSADTITLHADQRTLSFKATASEHFDAIRILVRPKSSVEP